jgi:hypothetical protein
MRRALAVLLLLLLAGAPPCDVRAQDGSEPVPIPGGFHFFSPGPRRLGYPGLHVEASTVTNFQGEVALAYLAGTARSAAGQDFLLAADMRVFRGEYVAADGITRRGAFGFV